MLVCTYGGRVRGLLDRLPPPLTGVAWLICHQLPDPYDDGAVDPGARTDIRYLRFRDRGLSRNRNHALRHARGRICLVADDDIDFLPDWHLTVLAAFRRLPGATFVSFGLVDGSGRPHRRYPTTLAEHDARSVFAVVSCELAFDLDAVRSTGVGFNELLGIGARIGRGEEGVFLRDLMSKGAVGWASGEAIARHEGPTTGDRAMAALGGRQIAEMGAVSFCKWGALAYAMVAKECVRLALHLRRPSRAPRFAWMFVEGIAEARRLGLDRGSVLARDEGGAPPDGPRRVRVR